MKISELHNQPDGPITLETTVNISGVDRLAGELINYMNEEMPGLTTGAAVEVLSVALWWVQYAAYNQFGKKVEQDSEHVSNSYWRQVNEVTK
jgi:uncharacterized membrane protein